MDSAFKTHLLSEEGAWTLFKKKTGSFMDDLGLYSIAKDIVHECKGSPGAIIAVSIALQNKEKSLWESALVQLRSSNYIDLPLALTDVYKPLKLSYDFLDNQQARSLFLLCSMFKKGCDISLELLTRYGIGLRMFEGIGNLGGARNRTCMLVKMLKSHFLLADGLDKEHVKMRYFVHDVAICIGSKEDHSLFCSAYGDSTDWPSEDCSWMSVDIPSSNMGLRFANLELLMMRSDGFQLSDDYLKSLDNFFEEKKELKVLSFENIGIGSLPPTTQLLKNLQMLRLFNCNFLETLSSVGELTSLEILSCQDCDRIEVLPAEVGRLNCLNLLELYGCKKLKTIAPGVISSLTRLEELKMRDSFTGWQAEERGNERTNAALTELESLPNLTCLEIELLDPNLAAKEIFLSTKIVKYNIAICWRTSEHTSRACYSKWTPEKCIYLTWPRERRLADWIHWFLRRAEGLTLIGDGSENLYLREVLNLRRFELGNNRTMEKLVNTIDWTFGVLPMLESLCLDNLPNIKVICEGPNVLAQSSSLWNLRELKLVNLPKLTHIWKSPNLNLSLCNLKSICIRHCGSLPILFSLSMARDLVRLEVLEITSCEAMQEVFWDDIVKEGKHRITFRKLKKLIFTDLPNLQALCKGVERIKFPQLTCLKIMRCEMLISLASVDSNLNLKGHDDPPIHVFCDQKVAFGSLKELILGLDPHLTSVWCCQIPALFLARLERLAIHDSDGISNLFSSSTARSLVNLKELCIYNCHKMVTVIAEDENVLENDVFPNLKILQLSDLPKLKSFGRTEHAVELPFLEGVYVDDCPGIETFTLGFLDTPNLRTFQINNKDMIIKRLNQWRCTSTFQS